MERTPERREAKRFEPPPWERAQFDELERQRVEQAAAEAEAEAARAAAQPEDAPVQPGEPEAPAPQAVEAAAGEPKEPVVSSAGEEKDAGEPGLTEEQMLLLLKAEEPLATKGVTTAATVLSAIVVVFGAVLMVWGIVAYMATRAATDQRGTWGAVTLIFFGVVFMGLGVYQGYKTTQKRGVL